jgi:hypothetical protein
MRRLAAGQNDITVSGAGRADEIGEMAKASSVPPVGRSERARLEAEAGRFQQSWSASCATWRPPSSWPAASNRPS